MLLGAVVEIALDSSAFGVTARHDTRSRRAQFIGLATEFVE